MTVWRYKIFIIVTLCKSQIWKVLFYCIKYRIDKTTLILIMTTWQFLRYQKWSHTNFIQLSAIAVKREHFFEL